MEFGEIDRIQTLRDRPVFLGGHPKSGTSLLRSLLDSHPQLVVYPEESGFFRRFLPQSKGLDLEQKLELAAEQLIHIFTWQKENQPTSQEGFPDRDYSSISFVDVNTELKEIIVQAGYRHDGDLLSAAVLAYGKVSALWLPEARHWVEKSPYNEYYAGQIFGWWPEARCINIVRDPRDNHTSYRRKHPDWEAEFFAANWQRSVKACRQNIERFGEARCCLIRYEDLVQKPQETLSQITEFLGIDPNPALTQPTRAGESWQGNSMFADQFSAISTAPLGRWKDTLAPNDAAVIEMMAGKEMSDLDYEATSGHSLSARWRASTWFIRRRFRNKKT